MEYTKVATNDDNGFFTCEQTNVDAATGNILSSKVHYILLKNRKMCNQEITKQKIIT